MATILEGLNAISQAVGGTGEAESNLEALNQISGALGGSADAENNADAIANIAENASGGGGGSVKVTIVNKSGSTQGLFVDYSSEDRLVPTSTTLSDGKILNAAKGSVATITTSGKKWKVLSGDLSVNSDVQTQLIINGAGRAEVIEV